ncbi:ribosomal-protein-alanine N-acetyltransferase [Mariprofundus micogutta]|uniref:Ribosomal-protein-alanine N-acetyltransferase n=1 Tax=Mariprofundus micogutta TaxID=1921010 RepID=A0A1L8CR98_9PROT|nr:ribosomal-protein-alanine N-acetyltransferase [Mariprofundus micogutta]
MFDEVQIMQIAVADSWRRQGLAAAMSEYLLQCSGPVQQVTLEVRVSNRAARALYARLGFEEVGLRKKYYAPDAAGISEDALLMSKYLVS